MSKTKTVKIDASKLRPGSVIQFTATAKVIALAPANDDEPSVETLYVLSLVGNSGPYNGRKVKVKVRSDSKLDAVLRNPWPLRLWAWLHKLLTEPRKP